MTELNFPILNSFLIGWSACHTSSTVELIHNYLASFSHFFSFSFRYCYKLPLPILGFCREKIWERSFIVTYTLLKLRHPNLYKLNSQWEFFNLISLILNIFNLGCCADNFSNFIKNTFQIPVWGQSVVSEVLASCLQSPIILVAKVLLSFQWFFQLNIWLTVLGGSWWIWSADNALFAPKVWEPVL